MNVKMLGSSIGTLVLTGALLTVVGANTQDGKRAQTLAPDEQPLIISVQGSKLYKIYCASCHGEDAKGHGPMAVWLKVPPSDLTRIAARNGGEFSVGAGGSYHFRRSSGVERPWDPGHAHLGPVFSQVTRDQDLGRVRIDNLARYLRDIQTNSRC